MKLTVRVFLSLALLESFLSEKLIVNGEGNYTETHTSSSWGYSAGFDDKIGIEVGYKDDHPTLGAKKLLDGSVKGHKENSQKDLYHAEAASSPPNNFGSGVGYPNGIPNNPANGALYYTQYALPPPGTQFASQWPQYARQQALQFTPQYYNYVPQYAYAQYIPQNTRQYIPQGAPQYAPQNVPQYAPQNVQQYAPQNVPQFAPQNVPQYAPQNVPQYAPQNVPQYAPQNVPQHAPQTVPQTVPQYAPRRAPPCATPNKAPDSSQQTINEECVH